MSFFTNPAQQMTLDDALFSLTARERKTLENSWAKVFADELFPKIDEEPFRVLYCENNGRPNAPINVLIGASIIKELQDYSDDDIVESLQRFRRKCYKYEQETGNDLMHTCIVSLSKEIARVMKISGKTRRMDSMMIDANIKKLSRLFSRCISEQTVREEGCRRLATHEDGTINSSILQNPSDPEATFRSKAGEEHRGYVANLEESVGENGSVITDYQFEQNTYSDSQFLADTLTAMEPSEEPVTIATDGAYPTPGNQKLAETKNVHIVSTNMPGKKVNDFYAGFELSDDGKTILACPGGIEPISCGKPYKNGQMRVTFPTERCEDCPHREQCPANKEKHISAFVLSLSSINRAKTQRMVRIMPGSAMVLKPCPRACGGTTIQTNFQGDGCGANYSLGSKSVH